MAIHPRHSLFLLGCSLVMMGILIGLLAPALVRADVGPQPVLPGGSSILPGEETPIQMAAEIVTINVRPADEADNALVELAPKTYGLQYNPVWFSGIAEVEADFTMKNPTSEALSLTAWFPLASALENVDWRLFRPGEIVPSIVSFQVSVDGNPVNYTIKELPNPKGADRPPLPWASFPVTFPGGKETVIHVSYLLPLQPSIKGSEMILYYIFQTGAGWAGPIGQAELTVNLPYPASAATLAGRRGRSLPPMSVQNGWLDLPPGAVLEGNQARWTWKDFEPGPEDDFAVWLLQPGKWQELETARAAVQAKPQDGQSWLDLASTYFSLSIDSLSYNHLLFSASYLPLCIKAYQKAAELLPVHPAPHAGLGLLTLVQYMEERNAPPEVIQSVQEELQIAKDLEAKNPALAKGAGISSWDLESALGDYFSYQTATADAVTQVVFHVTETAKATLDYATATSRANARAAYLACLVTAGTDCNAASSPTAVHTPIPASTSTPVPSATPQPAPTTQTPLVKPAQSAPQGQNLAVIVAAGLIGLVVVGYLVLKRLRKGASKLE